MSTKRQSKIKLIVLTLIIVLVVGGIIGYYYWKKDSEVAVRSTTINGGNPEFRKENEGSENHINTNEWLEVE